MSGYVVAALYHFHPLEEPEVVKEELLTLCEERGLCGTLLLATEGINGTVAGSREGIDALLAYLHGHPAFAGIVHKESHAAERPFDKMKVKVKREIVTFGVDGVGPGKLVGTYVKPHAWNDLISDPEVLVIDTRNEYEYEIGTFPRAVDPRTRNFRQFPDFVKQEVDPSRHKKVAMFCTGGIRCEKATGLLLKEGVEEVYHLEGGILKYLEVIPKEESLWEGECFVFDKRVALKHGLEPGSYTKNREGHPILKEPNPAAEEQGES